MEAFGTMSARLLCCGFCRAAGTLAPQSLKFGLAHLGVQQRSFGVFSSIRENLTDKVEQKKQKEMGIFAQVARF